MITDKLMEYFNSTLDSISYEIKEHISLTNEHISRKDYELEYNRLLKDFISEAKLSLKEFEDNAML